MFNILKYKIKLPSLFTFLAKLGMEFPNDPRPACFVAELYSIRSIDLNSNSCGLQLTMYTGSKQRAQRMGRLILTSYYKTKISYCISYFYFITIYIEPWCTGIVINSIIHWKSRGIKMRIFLNIQIKKIIINIDVHMKRYTYGFVGA